MGCFPKSHRPKNVYPKLAKIELSNVPYVSNDTGRLQENIIHSHIIQGETCIATELGQYFLYRKSKL